MHRTIPLIVIGVCVFLFRAAANCNGAPPPAKPTDKQPVTMLVFQLRIPKTMNFSPDTDVEFVTESHATAADLRYLKATKVGDALVFQHEFLVFEAQRPRRAIMVVPPPKKGERLSTTQVFRLSLPAVPVPSDWSKWQKPDCLEQGPASWNFIYDQKPLNRTTKIPPDAFELRYKVEKQML